MLTAYLSYGQRVVSKVILPHTHVVSDLLTTTANLFQLCQQHTLDVHNVETDESLYVLSECVSFFISELMR